MSDATGIRSVEIAPKRRSRLADFFIRLVKEKPLGTVSGIIILMLIFVAIFADVLAPYPYIEVHLADRLQGPSARYLLGTDHVGRDFLSRLIYGARLSLTVGLAATTINVVVAVLIGGTSGFLGGKLDLSVQRFVDAWITFPGLLLLLTIMSIVGQGLIQIILVLGISGGIGGSRVLRGAVIGIKENDYFLAAQAIGSPKMHRNTDAACPAQYYACRNHHIKHQHRGGDYGFGFSELPRIRSATLDFLTGEVCSAGKGVRYMEQAPHLALWPGLALTITIYCLNMFGDALRDLLDPRLRGAGG